MSPVFWRWDTDYAVAHAFAAGDSRRAFCGRPRTAKAYVHVPINEDMPRRCHRCTMIIGSRKSRGRL